MNWNLMRSVGWSFVVFGTLVLGVARPVNAQDVARAAWPQFRGPNVESISTEQDVFPTNGAFGLTVGWRRTIGEGMSGVAIANGLAVTMAENQETTWVVALDVETGNERWRYELAPAYASNNAYKGFNSTPLVAGNAVVALDMAGRLAGLDLLTGDLVWSVDLPDELNAREPHHGFATSPVLVDDTLIVQIGSEDARLRGLTLILVRSCGPLAPTRSSTRRRHR